jgi:hypothetical protein
MSTASYCVCVKLESCTVKLRMAAKKCGCLKKEKTNLKHCMVFIKKIQNKKGGKF